MNRIPGQQHLAKLKEGDWRTPLLVGQNSLVQLTQRAALRRKNGDGEEFADREGGNGGSSDLDSPLDFPETRWWAPVELLAEAHAFLLLLAH
ncbi:hypothetical protein CDAR_551651 [Caerostris darwini]|uniref:Uncharacterized protein n=1 Tax=Caerostris darwini TaxID=1538125 RepID=A0AAV4V5Y5_9ARAC|nr:hypothetical protein CDAR_551651 [Caerostris darwini]